MISNKEIALERKFYDDLRKKYRKRISHYPNGEICFKFEHGKYRPYLKLNNKVKYLNRKEQQLISRLIKKKNDETIVKCLEENIKLLEMMQTQYRGTEWIFGDKVAENFEESMGKGFRLADYISFQDDKYKKSSYEFRTSEKKHITPGGIKVRSKAELIIATFLEMKGIEYTYEKVMIIDGKQFIPDFTIRRASDGKIIIWEHFGMMDDMEYYDRSMEKLSEYHYAGYLPYDNFIATFGERDTSMDMTKLETIVETMLM